MSFPIFLSAISPQPFMLGITNMEHNLEARMSYVAHYPILLSVPGLIDAEGVDVTPKKAADALRALASEIESNPEQMKSLLRSGVVHSEVEDRWVLRSTTEPYTIRRGLGHWVELESSSAIDSNDTVTSWEARHAMLNEDLAATWCRPEDIGGMPVLAEFELSGSTGQTIDGKDHITRIDLRSWLASFTLDEVEEIIFPDTPGEVDNLTTLSMVVDFVEVGDPNILTLMDNVHNCPAEIITARIPDRDRLLAYLKDLHGAESFNEFMSSKEGETPSF